MRKGLQTKHSVFFHKNCDVAGVFVIGSFLIVKRISCFVYRFVGRQTVNQILEGSVFIFGVAALCIGDSVESVLGVENVYFVSVDNHKDSSLSFLNFCLHFCADV